MGHIVENIQVQKQTLLEQVASFENLYAAFLECSRGKRSSLGFMNFNNDYGSTLKRIQKELLITKSLKWGGYRLFTVRDPKKRIVMAAPFFDRVVHTAIHRVISPILEESLGCHTFACRIGMGNRNAVLRMYKQLQLMKKNRYTIKLDVKSFFQTINHEVLKQKLKEVLPDNSLELLFESLLNSYSDFKKLGVGLPIGNLTSQLFANLYLSSLDQLGTKLLNINYVKDDHEEHAFYIRYMDDIVIISNNKEQSLQVHHELINYIHDVLQQRVPKNKTVFLSNDPIPFLGFYISEHDIRPLRRNERRLIQKIKKIERIDLKSKLKRNSNIATNKQTNNSLKSMVMLSYEAWQKVI